MRILIVSDAWTPQVNGVVRTLQKTCELLSAADHEVRVVHPGDFRTIPCPTYPEIRLALRPGKVISQVIDDFAPEAIHISTEGPLGWSARRLCLRRGLSFTTSYHTRFPEYASSRFPVPVSWGYRIVRRFHGASCGVMVATPSVRKELAAWGFTNLCAWTRGVDTDLFNPDGPVARKLPGPVMVYVGRIAVEKNLEAFLKLDIEGTKLLVGDGPQLAELREKYPDALFVGVKQGEELAAYYRAGDVFVFPSLTDTFGLVMLEAMACGLPVAAFPVAGPRDVLAGSAAGVLDEDLAVAIRGALHIAPQTARDYALTYSWSKSVEQFLNNLNPNSSNMKNIA